MTTKPEPARSGRPLRLVVVGHVDHGKSTLVGRLLHDTGSLPEGRVEAVRGAAERRGMGFEWAFLLDALQAERDQGITIDTTRIVLRTPGRDTLLIDAPGHREFLKNMISGAAAADAAILVVDIAEGLREQTRRHAYLLRLLGVRQVVVAVNKMDAVSWDAERFHRLKDEISAYLASIGAPPDHVVPVSAREGTNLLDRDEAAAPWYRGPALIGALAGFVPLAEPEALPLRLPVQDVLKLDQRRIVLGRIESGRLKVGDALTFMPSGKTARIATLESWNAPAAAISASAGQSVGITLDDHLFIERGQIAVDGAVPARVASVLRARLFWLAPAPLTVGAAYRLRLATAEYPVEVAAIERTIDTDTLDEAANGAVASGGIAEVVLRSQSPMVFDSFVDNPRLGRFVLVDGPDVAGGGIVVEAAEAVVRVLAPRANLFPIRHPTASETRWGSNGHRGGVIWLTGLPASGKTTLAMLVEQELIRRGRQAFVIDGDNLRHGLNADLGFSPADRSENVRRAGEIAAMFAEAGMIAIAAFVSPSRADRARVRDLLPGGFHEVYVRTPVAECIRRDPKSLYRRAFAGELADFTGVSAPFEPPAAPELTLDTEGRAPEEVAAQLLDYIDKALAWNGDGATRIAG